MYIIVKQLSKANPTKKRHKVNCQKLTVNAVATPARNPIKLAPIKAGILPYWSAIHPKINPPKIAPMKKILWAMVGSASYWQTHPSCNRKLQSNDLLLITITISQEFYSNFNATIKRIFEQSFEIANETRLCPFLFPFEERRRRNLRPRAFSHPSSGCLLPLEEQFSSWRATQSSWKSTGAKILAGRLRMDISWVHVEQIRVFMLLFVIVFY